MNWKSTEFLKKEELGNNYWEQGFFNSSFGNYQLFKRDFEELRLRDLSIFTLGEIGEKKILDIGCGSGLYFLTFLQLGAKEVCGQDLSETAINHVAEKAKQLNYENYACLPFYFKIGFKEMNTAMAIFQNEE